MSEVMYSTPHLSEVKNFQLDCFLFVCLIFLFQYLSRGIQFSRASLNGALTEHKSKDIKTRQLIKLRQHVPQVLMFKVALYLDFEFTEGLYLSNDSR